MTVVVNGRFLRATPTGMHRSARLLLAELHRRGVPVDVVAPHGTDDSLVGRRVGWAPARYGDAIWEQTVLPLAARGRPVFSPTNLAPLLVRESHVWTHDLGPLVGPQWFAGRQVALYRRSLVAAAKRATTVLVPSRQVAAEVAALGVPAERVHLLRPPVDPSLRPVRAVDVERIRARYDLRRPYVVHLGCYDPRKDAAFAVQAHLRANTQEPHELLLAGRPHPIFPPVQWPAAPSVRAVGYVPDADLAALLTGAAALLFPSRYEGFGLPPLEAIACGTPPLASDIPAHRESTDGRVALLPLGDVAAWARAIVHAVRGQLGVPDLPPWTPADTADQFLAAVRSLAPAAG